MRDSEDTPNWVVVMRMRIIYVHPSCTYLEHKTPELEIGTYHAILCSISNEQSHIMCYLQKHSQGLMMIIATCIIVD